MSLALITLLVSGHRALLERQYLLPAALLVGAIVAYTFLYDLDFLFGLVHEKGNGTIFLSVIAVELLFLLAHAAIVCRA
jgi:hypothetical protein